MSKPGYVYVTYIRTTAEKLWQALIDPDFNRQYWFGAHQESDWKKGSDWKILFADGRIAHIETEYNDIFITKRRNQLTMSFQVKGYDYTESVAALDDPDDLPVRYTQVMTVGVLHVGTSARGVRHSSLPVRTSKAATNEPFWTSAWRITRPL